MIAIRVLALLLLSSAAAADTAAVSAWLIASGEHQFRIKDTRTIYVWRAVTGKPAECLLIRARQTLSQLNKPGYFYGDFSVSQTDPTIPITQAECYALPVSAFTTP